MKTLKLLNLLIIFHIASDQYAQPCQFYIPFYQDGKYGYSDTLGNIIIKPQFEYADLFQINRLTRIYSSADHPWNKNISTGMINDSGRIIVPCKYQSVYTYENFYSGYLADCFGFSSMHFCFIEATTHSDKKGLYSTTSGRQLLKDVFDEILYHNNIISARIGNKFTIFRYDLERDACVKIFQVTGHHMRYRENTANGVTTLEIDVFTDTKGRNFNTYNSSGKLLRSGKSFLLNDSLHLWNDDMPSIWLRTERVYAFQNHYGITNANDSFPAIYDTLILDRDDSLRKNIDTAIYIAKRNNRWGFTNGYREITPCIYDSVVKDKSADAHYTRYKVYIDGFCGLVDLRRGVRKQTIPCRYSDIIHFQYERFFLLCRGDLYGICRVENGQILNLLEPAYKKIIRERTLYWGNYFPIVDVINSSGRRVWVNWNGFEYCKL